MTDRRNSTLFVHKSLGTVGDGGGNANADVVKITNCSMAPRFSLGCSLIFVTARDILISSLSNSFSLVSIFIYIEREG